MSYTMLLQRHRQEKWAGELGRLWVPCVGHWWLCAFAVAFEQDHVQCCTLMVGLQH